MQIHSIACGYLHSNYGPIARFLEQILGCGLGRKDVLVKGSRHQEGRNAFLMSPGRPKRQASPDCAETPGQPRGRQRDRVRSKLVTLDQTGSGWRRESSLTRATCKPVNQDILSALLPWPETVRLSLAWGRPGCHRVGWPDVYQWQPCCKVCCRRLPEAQRLTESGRLSCPDGPVTVPHGGCAVLKRH